MSSKQSGTNNKIGRHAKVMKSPVPSATSATSKSSTAKISVDEVKRAVEASVSSAKKGERSRPQDGESKLETAEINSNTSKLQGTKIHIVDKSDELDGDAFFYDQDNEASEMDFATKKKPGVVLKIFAILLSAILFIYLAGVALFSLLLFYPNTSIFGADISLKTAASTSEILFDINQDFKIHVSGLEQDFYISSSEANINIDSLQVAKNALNLQSPALAWPLECFESHTLDSAFKLDYEDHSILQVVTDKLKGYNETATKPTDAFISYSKEASKFVINPEILGTSIDPSLVAEDLLASILRHEETFKLSNKHLLRPLILSTNEVLLKQLDQANHITALSVPIYYDDVHKFNFDSQMSNNFVKIEANKDVSFDFDAFRQFCDDYAENLSTAGGRREYLRPDGKHIVVEGGDYGWTLNTEGVADQIYDRFVTGKNDPIRIEVYNAARQDEFVDGKDWGKSYIDIDLDEQYARYYDDKDNIIWESEIISGKPSTPTTLGVWYLKPKHSPSKLVGAPLPGQKTPEYETYVSYWMPFVGNAIGLHDATWQSAFGGERYLQGFGSHGCVNLPYDKAEELYNIIEDEVVIVVQQQSVFEEENAE